MLVGEPLRLHAGALRRPWQRLAVRTAVSEEAQRNVEAAFGESCEILPNGVDVDSFASASPWPAPRPALMFVGRHEPRKGLAVLLEAYSGRAEAADALQAAASDIDEFVRGT